MFKVSYKLKNLNVADKLEIDNFVIESNEEVTKLSKHWSLKKWKEYIQMILFARIDDSLTIVIPNPIKLPGKAMEQFTKKLRVEKNLEKWLKDHGYDDYEKTREVVK